MEREIDQINHRFDDLSHQMDRRFDEQSHQMDKRFDEQSRQMNRRFDEQNRRLDEQSKRFEEQGHRFDELSQRVEAGFGQVAGRLDALQRTLIQIAFGAFFTFVASVIGYFLTQH